jgi:hypothetical protein
MRCAGSASRGTWDESGCIDARNGLVVFLNTEQWSTSAMQRLTQEMRQFESIFLSAISHA